MIMENCFDKIPIPIPDISTHKLGYHRNRQLVLLPVIFSREYLGIQLSLQIWILLPFPTHHHMIPFLEALTKLNSLPGGDESVGNIVSISSPFGKYLAFNRQAHRLSGCATSLQASLANRARLNHFISREPIPPMCLSNIIFSQAIQCTFLRSGSSPRQKFGIVYTPHNIQLVAWKSPSHRSVYLVQLP